MASFLLRLFRTPKLNSRTLKLNGAEGQKQNKTKQKTKPKTLSRKSIYKEEEFFCHLKVPKR